MTSTHFLPQRCSFPLVDLDLSFDASFLRSTPPNAVLIGSFHFCTAHLLSGDSILISYGPIPFYGKTDAGEF